MRRAGALAFPTQGTAGWNVCMVNDLRQSRGILRTIMTMKALVKAKAEPGLWLEEVPLPKVGTNDVLIRVDRTGICGTDLHIYNSDAWAQATVPVPMVVGHEFVGEVVQAGADVMDCFRGAVVSAAG